MLFTLFYYALLVLKIHGVGITPLTKIIVLKVATFWALTKKLKGTLQILLPNFAAGKLFGILRFILKLRYVYVEGS